MICYFLKMVVWTPTGPWKAASAKGKGEGGLVQWLVRMSNEEQKGSADSVGNQEEYGKCGRSDEEVLAPGAQRKTQTHGLSTMQSKEYATVNIQPTFHLLWTTSMKTKPLFPYLSTASWICLIQLLRSSLELV